MCLKECVKERGTQEDSRALGPQQMEGQVVLAVWDAGVGCRFWGRRDRVWTGSRGDAVLGPGMVAGRASCLLCIPPPANPSHSPCSPLPQHLPIVWRPQSLGSLEARGGLVSCLPRGLCRATPPLQEVWSCVSSTVAKTSREHKK